MEASLSVLEAAAQPRLMGIGARALVLPLCAVAVVLLCAPMFAAQPSNLTSDESLYLAEAYNIAHGEGATYPSGETVVHRAPLFPGVLAPFVRLAGNDAAYSVTKAIVAINAVLVMLIAYRMAGALAGAVSGIAASGSAYLSGMGTTLYLDPLQCTLLLLTVMALFEASRTGRVRWFAVAGVLTGLAFLVKESAMQWAPLGALVWLMVPSLRSTAGARGALAYTVAFGTAISPWFAWVWIETGELFLLGEPSPLAMALFAGSAFAIAVFALAIAMWPALPANVRVAGRASAPALATGLVAAWLGFMLYGLTRYSMWPYPNDYLVSIPHYMSSVAAQAQPYLLLLLAWVVVAMLAVRRDVPARLLAAGALLFLPFALFTANRDLQLRDALPLVYLSYIALGVATAWVVRITTGEMSNRIVQPLLLAFIAGLGALFVVQQGMEFSREHERDAGREVAADSWDSDFVRENAAWMRANLPEDAAVLSSRLYFSSLYVHTDARYRIHQLPTVRVDVDTTGERLLTPASNLFRWGEPDVRPYRQGDGWMYLRQFPGKAYWIAMSQRELMEYIAGRDIEYVVLSGDDMTFSSLALAPYFSVHPAFDLVHHNRHSAADQFFVYRVDSSQLGLIEYPLVAGASSLKALEAETGLSRAELESALGVRVRVSDAEVGLSAREEIAAAVDAGAR